jgi:hypothetical protein
VINLNNLSMIHMILSSENIGLSIVKILRCRAEWTDSTTVEMRLKNLYDIISKAMVCLIYVIIPSLWLFNLFTEPLKRVVLPLAIVRKHIDAENA